MDNLLIFGASGQTGQKVVLQVLEKGYAVTVVLRTPGLFKIEHPRLTLIKGDVLDPSSYIDYVRDCAAIISCLGTGTNLGPTTVYSKGIEAILSGMAKHNVSRLICLSAGALEAYKEMGIVMNILTKVVLHRILKNVYDDMRQMESRVKATDFDWTIIRPARLTDGPLKKKYRTAIQGHVSRPWTISRADLAHYIITILNDSRTFHAKVEITY